MNTKEIISYLVGTILGTMALWMMFVIIALAS